MNIKAILSLASVGLLLYTVYEQNEAINRYKTEKVQMKSDVKIVDSLKTELFQAQSMNGRYELALEHLREENPSSFSIVEEFMNHETE
jgi:hypothetical protein